MSVSSVMGPGKHGLTGLCAQSTLAKLLGLPIQADPAGSDMLSFKIRNQSMTLPTEHPSG